MGPSSNVERPSPAAFQPPLRWWSQAWRFALALVVSGVVLVGVWDTYRPLTLVVDIALGAVAAIVTLLRRRHPVPVAVVTALLGAFSGLAAGFATLALVSLSTRRRWVEIAPIAVLGMVTAQVFSTMRPTSGTEPWWVAASFNVVATAATVAWGLYLGSRRELLWTLRRRAERAEAEQSLRVAQSRLAERSRIAREMHDVLAHRISQVSLHAGALTYRDDLTAEEMRASAAVIQATAHQALTDLRGVLGVLREPGGEPLEPSEHAAPAPQPTLADLPELVAVAREAGVDVDYDHGLPETPPDAAGRTVYRIVQEGITNATKHAPGAQVTVRVGGDAEAGIDVLVRNPLGFRSSSHGRARPPGAHLGLVGLTERAELAGGRLRHGAAGGVFELQAWIPWRA